MTKDASKPTLAGKRVALGVTGGIAAYKAAEVLRGLQQAGCAVRVAMTERACEFITPLTFRALSGEHVVVDDYAPDNPDPIAHITFSQTVDLFVIAPATADIIAKFANGIADDFLSSTYLASTAPILIAPAMNPQMWQHPATVRNLQRLRSDGVHVIEPDAGEMACGTVGPGRLSDPTKIVRAALNLLLEAEGPAQGVRRDLTGERILITAGATREPIDPVRFLSNHSSGRMGFALAEAALGRGAEVILVAGHTTAPVPSGVRLVDVTSAEEMRRAVIDEVGQATIFVGAAAVADYRPVQPATQKIKKSKDALTIILEPTPDILAEVSASRHHDLIVVGFAAETDALIERARRKFERKQLDMVVANDVTQPGAGFDTETNIVTIITRQSDVPIELPLLSKRAVADRILDEVAALRRERSIAAFAPR